MHYYSFHPGDYLKDTAHLTNEEDLTYRRLLDFYHQSESPIPVETQSVSRRLRVGSEVVNQVLAEFFELREDGWHQARCDAAIADYQRKCGVNREVGKLGGRPRKIQAVSTNNPEPRVESAEDSAHHSPTSDQEQWLDPREYPTLKTVEQWAVQVMAPKECAAKWHAIRVSENWETQYGRPLQLAALPNLFRSYASNWKANGAKFKSGQTKPSEQRIRL